jgi:hypothetical protein
MYCCHLSAISSSSIKAFPSFDAIIECFIVLGCFENYMPPALTSSLRLFLWRDLKNY